MKQSINQLCSKRAYHNVEGDEAAGSQQEKKTFFDKAKDFLKTDVGKQVVGKGVTLATQAINKGRGQSGGVTGSVGSGGSGGGEGGGGIKDKVRKLSPMTYVYIGLGVLIVGGIAYLAFRKK